jgi:hypothetical protein
VFADPERLGGKVLRMDMSVQEWRKLPKSDVHVGMWRDARPTPDELARVPLIAGYDIRLADAQAWKIPLVRRFDQVKLTTESALPCYMECDDDGTWRRGKVLDVHAHLWDVTAPVADALLAEYTEHTSPDVKDADIFKCVCALLAANYCVGPGELSLMQALTNEASVHAACMAACDWATFEAWAEQQKKSPSPPAAAGSTTSVGVTV